MPLISLQLFRSLPPSTTERIRTIHWALKCPCAFTYCFLKRLRLGSHWCDVGTTAIVVRDTTSPDKVSVYRSETCRRWRWDAPPPLARPPLTSGIFSSGFWTFQPMIPFTYLRLERPAAPDWISWPAHITWTLAEAIIYRRAVRIGIRLSGLYIYPPAGDYERRSASTPDTTTRTLMCKATLATGWDYPTTLGISLYWYVSPLCVCGILFIVVYRDPYNT